MRKSRGKREVEKYNNEGRMESNYGENNLLEFPCKKHPTSSATSGGICAYCLTDRLYQLVCPQCGEQRYSSNCSCTDHLYSSFDPNSSSTTDVGHRISFLLENDKLAHQNNNNNNYYNNNNNDVSSSRPRLSEHHRVSTSSNVDDYATLRRSNSTCVGDLSYNYNNNNFNNNNSTSYNNNIGRKESKEKFWKIGRLFRKKKDKSNHNNNNYNYSNNNNNMSNEQENNINNNNNNECKGVTRSRSLCSFRGFYDPEESGHVPISSSAARASSVSTSNFYVDSAKQSCFSESEARMSNFDTYFDPNGFNKLNPNNNSNSNNNNNSNSVFSSDDPAYIDLKLHDDVSSRRVPELGALRRSGLGMSTKEFSFRRNNNDDDDDDDVVGSEMFRNGSCRRSSVTERELRKCRKSSKVLRWFFRQQQQQQPTSGDNYQDDHPHGFN
ncbi:hypothetical protein vseg_001686 [Gypsophila vaccaria]